MPPAEQPRLVAFFGSTIGNLDEAARASFFSDVARMLEPCDRFLLGIDLVKDRETLHRALAKLEPTDEAGSERVVILGRSAARELFPDGSPIGQRIQFGWSGYEEVGATVVGVVEDIRFDQPGSLPERLAFVPIRQAPQLETGILVRASSSR